MDNLSIQTRIQPLSIKANVTLTEVLLMNLFHNAIRHTTANGKVTVEIHGDKLRVSNTGNELKMNSNKMFERFSKESKSEGSTGLGLAIVKKICDSCGYDLRYTFYDGEHTFFVTFCS